MSDLELQQYLFDLQGYLVIENALSPEEVATLNQLVDDQGLPETETGKSRNFGRAPEGSGLLEWGQPFCDLLDHPLIMSILRFQLGESFRLDRLFGIQMREGMPRGGLHADYGASAKYADAKPGEYFPFRNNQIYDGFVVVSWNLVDTGPGLGGLYCIPGSHKSNYKLPPQIRDAPEDSPNVIMPSAPAGSVVLFTEALTHGTAAWQAKYERRSLLYKYCVSHMAWSVGRVQPPASVELTPRQQILLRDPADPLRHFPSLFEEVESVV